MLQLAVASRLLIGSGGKTSPLSFSCPFLAVVCRRLSDGLVGQLSSFYSGMGVVFSVSRPWLMNRSWN